MEATLAFVPFVSAPDVGFWRELGRRKLDELGLDASPVPVWARFEVSSHGRSSSLAFAEGGAFGAAPPPTAAGAHVLRGKLVNTNTLEEFKTADKNQLMARAAAELREELGNSAPEALSRMLVLTFADLKLHEYYYWFAFPALAPADAPAGLASFFVVRAHVRGLVVREGEAGEATARSEEEEGGEEGEEEGEGAFEVGPLARWTEWCALAANEGKPKPMLAFADPVAEGPHPGWPLRNLLMWVRAQPHAPTIVQVICWREVPRATGGTAEPPARSLVLAVRLLPGPESGVNATSLPTAVGWERNARGKLGARMVSLRAQLDPVALAESSVDLNLRLMRWRLLPELQTEKLAGLKCLLVGAGTLGCNVARALMGWGVRHITFVDGGAVSHSNPVRQSLFTFADCASSERRAKAVAAAQAVTAIFPGVTSVGHEVMVPMPGHPIAEAELEGVKAAVALLEQLVAEHDAVFLLMDTRESRWLPSLLCAAQDKLAITAALGFDSYVVMRHGKGPSSPSLDAPALHEPEGGAAPAAVGEGAAADGEAAAAAAAAGRLGCYFCNDVVAPVDSTRDRTLDQQCTVTRPGLSMVASALAVEMLVSVAHHPLGHGAAADLPAGEASTPLGLLPHQIRGFLPTFRTELLCGQSFSCCVACSQRAVSHYREGGFEFLLRAFREPGFLEEFSGLRQLQEQALAALETWGGDEEGGGDDF
ncbi:hypothetical protein T492DRAFT_627529 [Pavlovales sp. CCMP2436]|nr:hypothetical protein T492DRAFT_627529 [Pavlovales sp. CCMP2436]